jgi:hypothetical protein
MARRIAVAVVSGVPMFAHFAGAQSPPGYAMHGLAGGVFVEQVHSEVTTQTGSAERHRTITRVARYAATVRADTLVITADSLRLDETADGTHQVIDVDAVIGGRWRLLIDARGLATVVEVPFVPGTVADVSDLSSAMDDFFPAAPPMIAPGAQFTDSSHRAWRRLADSAAARRFRWSEQRPSDTTYMGPDSVQVHTMETAHEDGNVAWNVQRGPVAWSRHIQTTVTSHFAGRTVRAIADQRIVVSRLR